MDMIFLAVASASITKLVLIPAGILGLLGIIYGVGLAFAAKAFFVETDPKIEQITAALPGANCGGCGFAGCAGYADSIVTAGAKINMCAPGGPDAVDKIAAIMGMTVDVSERKVAVIHCQSGGANNTYYRHDYRGAATCKAAVSVAAGPNLCNYGCVFLNDCVAACVFDALHVDDNGMRVVDREKCTGCGACAAACPRGLIEMAGISKEVHVLCMSHDKGPVAKKNCGNQTACIGCGLCVKKCPSGAIEVKDFLAVIDYDKCTVCGACAIACPTKAIADPKKGQRPEVQA
jgi:Na+-translocating ferredoxin:NAD+ oxidoreductase subunit B